MPVSRVESIPTLSKRPSDAHKGLFGTVLVVAGSRGMAGAAALCGAAALRSGAGLSRIICPNEVQPTVASFEPSYMTFPVANDDCGHFRFDAAKQAIHQFAADADVLAVGPGLGRSDQIRQLTHWILHAMTVPVVLDADGLNVLEGGLEPLKSRKAPTVVQQSGALPLLIWGERLPRGRGYVVHLSAFDEPLPEGTLAQAESAAAVNRAMERLIRQCPQQYLWGYHRYKHTAGVANADRAEQED